MSALIYNLDQWRITKDIYEQLQDDLEVFSTPPRPKPIKVVPEPEEFEDDIEF